MHAFSLSGIETEPSIFTAIFLLLCHKEVNDFFMHSKNN